MQIPPVDRIVSTPPSPAAEIAPVSGVGGAARPHPGAAPATSQSTDYVATPLGGRGPDNPSTAADMPNRDWTEVRKPDNVKPPEEPPREPLYRLLLDHLQSMWRASTQVADIAEELQRQALRSDGAGTDGRQKAPIVYADPGRVKRSPSSSSSSST